MIDRLLLVAGTTATGRIQGISAAGTAPERTAHTPSLDAEIVAYGRPVSAEWAPVSPTGCITPAAVTRAVRELLGFDLAVIDAGLRIPTAAPTIGVGAEPGRAVTAAEPVADARGIVDRARALGRSIPADRLAVGETIPGGTTTALGVLRALGEPGAVSSSLPENPIARKEGAVAAGLEASGLEPGELAGDPIAAVHRMGDPVLAAAYGLVRGGLEAGTAVTLAGGTQLLAVAAMVRHAGTDDPLTLETTVFVERDVRADLHRHADRLAVSVTVTDPGFDRAAHPAMARYEAGEAKEGVGMGGALAAAERAAVPFETVRDRITAVTGRLLDGSDDGPDDRSYEER